MALRWWSGRWLPSAVLVAGVASVGGFILLAEPLGDVRPVPAETLDAWARDAQEALTGMGFSSDWGQEPDRGSTGRWVSWHSGRTSVLVEIHGDGLVLVDVESGCLPGHNRA